MKSEAKVIATYIQKIKGNNSRSGQGGFDFISLIRLTGFWVLDQFLDSPTSCQALLHPQQPHNRKRRRLRSVETRLRCMSIRNLNTKELIRTARLRKRPFYLRRDNSRDVQQQSVDAKWKIPLRNVSFRRNYPMRIRYAFRMDSPIVFAHRPSFPLGRCSTTSSSNNTATAN